MTDQQHQPEPGVSDVARLRGIALMAAARVHQRITPTSSASSTADPESVVRAAVRFAEFLANGR